MHYIHIPTGEIYDKPYQTNLDINDFIRALPEYWRVEGYDKSLEWAKYQPAYDPSEHRWDFVTNKKGRNVFDRQISDVTFMQLPQISRAEFEYYIYNPWKGQEPHYNQQPIEVIDMMLAVYGKEAVIHFCLLNSFKYRMRAGHKDNAIKDIDKAVWYEKKAKELEMK